MRKWVYLSLSLLIISIFAIIIGCTSGRSPQAPATSESPMNIMGRGGVTGPGGMTGSGGMMMPGTPYQSGGERISMDKAVEIINAYLAKNADPDLKATELLEFTNNFYVGFREKSRNIYAYAALIDPFSGDMYSEPGPNMMWNAKYGMISGMMLGNLQPSLPMTVTEGMAIKNAQAYLDAYLPGAQAGAACPFYGYYTIKGMKDGHIYGLLSVNGYTGQVWYHFWHGPFIGSRSLE